jgi:RIO-like serine/threonine protein kinase
MELKHDHFTIIYKILSTLEQNMDTGQPINTSLFNHDTLGITQARFTAYLEMLSDSGYIKGIQAGEYIRTSIVRYENAKITLKGLEYLAENTFMKRAYKAVQGLTDVVGDLIP